MKNERAYIFMLHGVVRALLLNSTASEASLAIYKAVFPGAVGDRFLATRRHIDQSYLQMVADLLYEMDRQEIGYSSCYSVSLVLQIIAFVHGVDSQILLGVKKQDKKLIGHAWLQIFVGPDRRTVSPGHVSTEDFQVISQLNPDHAIQTWMDKKCASGPF